MNGFRDWIRCKAGPPELLSAEARLGWAQAGLSFVTALLNRSYDAVVLGCEGLLTVHSHEDGEWRLRGEINRLAASGVTVVITAHHPEDWASKTAGWTGLRMIAAGAPHRVTAGSVIAALNDARIVAGQAALLAVADSARYPELMRGCASLAVGHPSPDPASGWFLGEQGDSGVTTACRYLAKLTARHGTARFAPDSFVIGGERGVSCLITDRAQSLAILQRKDGTYPVPQFRYALACFGGQVEPGESPDAAIRREISEEIIDSGLRETVLHCLMHVCAITTTFGHHVDCYLAVLPDLAVHAARVTKLPTSQVCSEGEMVVRPISGLSTELFAWDSDLVIRNCLDYLTGNKTTWLLLFQSRCTHLPIGHFP